ncbi:hypothetical protein FPV67DRAFT_878295 [Lyophyllum atratum]|nr:hypothetical protein FPV67DRAFT_878295 [Lyophyllum atratum]
MNTASAVQKVLYRSVPHTGKRVALVHSFHLWETGKPTLRLQLPRGQRSYSTKAPNLRRFETDLRALLSHFCDAGERRKYGNPDLSIDHPDTESEDLSQATPVRALGAAIDVGDYCLLEYTSARLVEMLRKDDVSSKVYIGEIPPSLRDHLKLEVLGTLGGLSAGPPRARHPSFDWAACVALFGSRLAGEATVGITYPSHHDGPLPSLASLLDVVLGRHGPLLLRSARPGDPAQLFAEACSDVFYAWNVSREVCAPTDLSEFGEKVALLVAFTPDRSVEPAFANHEKREFGVGGRGTSVAHGRRCGCAIAVCGTGPVSVQDRVLVGSFVIRLTRFF